MKHDMIPVIDIFAGPGGLSEGFSSMNGVGKKSPFDIVLSIEKEINAVNTLIIRAAYRILCDNDKADVYYKWLMEKAPTIESLSRLVPEIVERAKEKVIQFELGGRGKKTELQERISKALGDKKNWVLVGGPPCQAYSLIGRVKNMSLENYLPEDDKRFILYLQYLEILSKYQPAVFILENVKGLLSAKLNDESVIQTILKQLQRQGKGKGVKYKLYSLVDDCSSIQSQVKDRPDTYVIHSEEYGVPQKRHRLIIMGIRSDIPVDFKPLKKCSNHATVGDALNGLPIIRSRISKGKDSIDRWKDFLESFQQQEWLSDIFDSKVKSLMIQTLEKIKSCKYNGNQIFYNSHPAERTFMEWVQDSNLTDTPIQHEARSHMDSDLFRYLFVSCYTKVHGFSPKLKDFPEGLLPKHANVNSGNFVDRFRAQADNAPATTVTSHISKDGHYYIHPDPVQCRSLTVREAARLQTFPDNYFFSGNRTEQFHQVGNAVPPYLVMQIAHIVHKLLQLLGQTKKPVTTPLTFNLNDIE